ncbi:hypothetical protein [Leeuwenhoekiella parthenopeia]|uniref:Uncharacterized protein n=1 Tax=Leeuwenhoekiella parthenopeia TaxID=2890320 RepID=A0ABS8GW54_9FLAO|nr:hypothetical protein [Leeuwenhoekiella parthenopeia]MCC4214251.1 hypothetical protein [Leeuwenhoekiella parthenopeia]
MKGWYGRIPLLFWLIFLFPYLSIFFDLLDSLTFKRITDSLFVYGSYYSLPFIALAIVALRGKIDLIIVFANTLKFLIPLYLSVFYFFLFRVSNASDAILLGQAIMNNLLIPGTLFLFLPKDRKTKIQYYLGWSCILLIFIISAKIWSRSYSLVGLILLFFAAKHNKLISLSNIIISFCVFVSIYFFGLSSIFTQESLVRENSSVFDKFQLDSLIEAFSDFLNTGSFASLFFWEGNSRSQILIDAFQNFSFLDWAFGKGVFATYDSFVRRSTIEIGWAQDAFRWGLLWVFSVLIISVLSARNFFKRANLNAMELNVFFGVIVTVKTIDAFIYGVPAISFYNLIYFLGIIFFLKNMGYAKIN